MNSSIYYSDGKDLWVNLYIPSRLDWKEKGMVLEQDGSFPMDSVVRFFVDAGGDDGFAVNFFIPSWARNVEVSVNGEKCNGRRSSLSFYRIRRNWKKGDVVELCFHYDFYLKSMPDDENVVALFYGPTLLAFETSEEIALRGCQDDVLKGLKCLGNGRFELENNGRTYRLKPFYMIDAESYGVYAVLRNL